MRLGGEGEHGGVVPVGEVRGELADVRLVNLLHVGGHRCRPDLAAAEVVGEHGVQEPGEQPAAAERAVGGDGGQHGGLHGEQQGQRRAFDVLGGSALAVHAQRVARVALQPHVQHRHTLGVAPGHHVEDAALGADDREAAAVVGEQGRGRFRGHVVGDQPGHGGHLDGLGLAREPDRVSGGGVALAGIRRPRRRLSGLLGGLLGDLAEGGLFGDLGLRVLGDLALHLVEHLGGGRDDRGLAGPGRSTGSA